MTVWESDLHGAHGADVETKQTTPDDGDGRDEVDVAVLFHHVGQCALVCRRVCKCGGSESRGVNGARSEM